MKTLLCVVCLALTWGVTRASLQSQSPPAAPAASFEVASVKPSDPNASNSPMSFPSMRPQGQDGMVISNMPLRLLVRFVYAVQDFQIIGGPSWQMSSKFDITAKAAEGTAKGTPDMMPMLKSLLADRFKLRTHTESREMPIYALVVARSDGKLGQDIKPSTSDCSNAAADARKRAEELAKGGAAAFMAMLAKGEKIPCTMMPAINPSNPAAGFGLRADGQPMTSLTQLLTQATGRVVLDKTGLTGLYDWELRFDPTVFMALLPQLGINIPGAGAGATANSPFADSPSLLTALQEQLGLKLDSQRGPVEVLVIDSAEMPQPD
jgi:uncharacterized protein (TIGR03435 family)